MAYERTWAFSYNNAYTPTSNADQTKYQMWALGSMLLGNLGGLTLGLWTLDSSCNSLSASAQGSGIDNLHLKPSAVYTAGDWVQAGGGSAHSWYVLKSPTMNGNTFYMLVAADTATTTSASILMAKVPFTGGTTTANPTSTDSWVLGTVTSAWNAGASSGILNRFNIALSSVGDFIYFPVQVGQAQPGISSLGIAVIAPVGCHPTDAYPIWTYKFFSASTPGGFTETQLAASSTQPSRGPIGAGFVILLVPSSNQITANNLDLFSGAQTDLACFVAFQTASTWGARGRLPDVRFILPSSTDFKSGAFMRDGSNNITYVSVGRLWIPSGNIPPILT